MKLLETKQKPTFVGGFVYLGWGSWIRTNTDGVRVRSSTVKLCPKRRGLYTTFIMFATIYFI